MYTSGLLLFGLGAQEIVIILVIVLLLFGGKKIPELMRGLGRGVKEFKDGQKDDDTANTDARDTNEKTNNQ
ncbi:twin-arginine translocase TatA/TatE family subunit [Sphingobacterium olei]|uniref:Sec-independent protein translocase protein TatA n=1 Tax=Sphingobacterium olei TaxID=2571155 RepID=A0A4U0PF69_9SPHI|nr:twin-arginine translocase TatA/TatE family subunit [Sphingobacterium olei]TJZ61394.1 twin-arginine translocase TatA/TatE family subunit [Sphingobacterium olei]